jgi:hypothetical protein
VARWWLGKPWENHGKTMGKPWENRGMPCKWRFLMGRSWETTGHFSNI